jgi:hypothetical protein
VNFLDARLPARFWSKVSLCEQTGCWLFVGARNRDGYGSFSLGGKVRSAHRVAYEVLVGPVPHGLELDHARCQTPACCNPSHLEPVTHRENMLRGKTNCIMAARAKSVCPKGHPYSHRHKNGARRCAICIAEQTRRAYIAKHGDRTAERRARDELIRRDYATGRWTMPALGAVYGVRKSQVSNIVRRQR